jgi:hypothetical protein
MKRINKEINAYLEGKGIGTLEEIRGRALKALTDPEEIVRWSGEPLTGSRNAWR